jgi:hypothetical protein
MRTTITLADDVYQAAKVLAEGSGRSLGEVVSELVRRALRPPPPGRTEGGLPVFAVAPDAPIIPGHRAAELLAGEGADDDDA